jgi:hypothetical protein
MRSIPDTYRNSQSLGMSGRGDVDGVCKVRCFKVPSSQLCFGADFIAIATFTWN